MEPRDDWRAGIRRCLAQLALPPTREIEIVEEIAQHLEDRRADLRARGASEEDAIEGAWCELEEADMLARAMARVEGPSSSPVPPPGASRLSGWPRTVWQDVRYSARSLRGSPTFLVTVLLAVALSIGPVTAILSMGNWLLWRPHPGVTDARSLAIVWFGQWGERGGGTSFSPAGVSYENLAEIRSRARSFSGIAGVQESSSSLSVPGALPRQTGTAMVTADFFDVLGVRLAAGRSFTPEEDRAPFGAPVAVISDALAKSAFGSAGAAVGKSVTLNSQPFTVIGVAAPAFAGTSTMGGIDAWMTGATWPYLNHVKEPRAVSRADGIFYEFIVRRARGRTLSEVESELKVLARQLADLYPLDNTPFLTAAPRVFPELGLSPLTRPSTKRTIDIMLMTGAVLLLLGCANVANLLIFRATRRAHEVAIRKALGASPARLMQLQVTESCLLSLTGAALGLAFSVYFKQLIEHLLFPSPPETFVTVPLDLRVLGFTTAVAVATGTLAALAPGWLLVRSRELAALGRATTTWARAPKLRGSLAVLQLALSLTLLVSALLLVSTLRNLRAVDLGFDPGRVTVVTFGLDEHGYDAQRAMAYHREVLPALQASGEFEAVSVAALVPFGPSYTLRVVPPGAGPATPLRVLANGVSDGYFQLLAMPLLRGRAFTAEEAFGSGEARLAIVNEALARQLFRTIDAVGRTVRLARTQISPERDLSIVGVVKDSRWRSLRDAPAPFLYQPYGEFQAGKLSRGVYMMRSPLPSLRAGLVANSIAARTASGVPLADARPLAAGIDSALSDQRVFAWMLSLLAALGFTLAALGLYGLVAQATLERRREFGIRLALGASGGHIIRLVARHATVVSVLGIAIGLALSFFGARILRSLLFGVSPLEPAVYIAAIAILTFVVALACIVPALRALRVQPIQVLRENG